MNNQVYSNEEFTKIKEDLNKEILRRGTFKWWDPLTIPSVGIDRTSPLSLPINEKRMEVDDKTYTINNPSENSIEPTKNIKYPVQGENPAGQNPEGIRSNIPNTSAAQLNVDEIKNFLVGLSKIQDINLFYGREEVKYTAFRDPKGIEEALIAAQNSELNAPLKDSDISPTKNDPNGGIIDRKNPNYPVNHEITYPMENGEYVMPSGEYNGEELTKYEGLGPHNFYDDYGASPGDNNFHPYNRYKTPEINRDWHDHDHDRNIIVTKVREGGLSSYRFGPNPRNPEQGDPLKSRPAYGGKQGSCLGQCVGLCYQTCDNQCGESCTTTCFNRCGNGCSSSCSNSCTGCSSQCYQTCKTKCENSVGYSCLKAGAKAIKITTTGGKNGEPAENHISVETHSCGNSCSFSCQYYPNKKTECWDSGCMGKCFTSCNTSCSTSCYGGCIDNDRSGSDKDNFKTGKGRGCSSGCTLNCIGNCSGVCEGYCVQTCWHTCKSSCADNCVWECNTVCGHGCDQGCTKGCTGCSLSCDGSCKTQATARDCVGCGSTGGCTSQCQFDCNSNCMGFGCRNICGIDSAGSCESSCRLNCMASSCTAMCSEACSNQCTTCVNSCGFQCGACASSCSVGCTQACNISCTDNCSNSCNDNCVQSCSEACGACSNLCYSCVGMCIGICSLRCENGCSSCANLCGWWCDSSCNRECFGNCSTLCITTCVGSCSTSLTSEAKTTIGPDRGPTQQNFIYNNPKNRWEERESFKLLRDIQPYIKPDKVKEHKLITIDFVKTKRYIVLERPMTVPYEKIQKILKVNGNIITTNIEEINISEDSIMWRFILGKWVRCKIDKIFESDYLYLWDTDSFGSFTKDTIVEYLARDTNIVVTGPDKLKCIIYHLSTNGGVYSLNKETGEVVINVNMLPGNIHENEFDASTGGGLIIVKLLHDDMLYYTDDDIEVKVPFGFEVLKFIHDKDNNVLIVIKRDEFLFPEEREGNNE